MKIVLAMCLSLAFAVGILPAIATMRRPHQVSYFSTNKQYRIDTIPGGTWAPSGTEQICPTCRAGACKGVLSKLSAKDMYSVVWTAPLLNSCEPGTALVTNDGQFVVTLCDWFPKAEENFVVIYDAQGRTVKQFSLDDLLKETETKRPPAETLHKSSDGKVMGRPWIDQPCIDESADKLTFILRTGQKPGVNYNALPNWKDSWNFKNVTIKLSAGKLSWSEP